MASLDPAEPGAAAPAGRPWLEEAAGRAAALRERLALATAGNPVLVKEFRTRMRGSRAYALLLVYTLFLATVLALMYLNYQAHAAGRSPGAGGGPEELGRAMYHFAFTAQALMVAVITPALTSGAITMEREQRSYELLAATSLRAVDVIRGKLAAAVSFVALLLTASLPLVSLVFLVGGVSPAEVLCSYQSLLLAAFLYGAIGLAWSAAVPATTTATVLAYGSVLGLFVITLLPGVLALSVPSPTGIATPAIPFQSLNPLTASLRGVLPEYLLHAQAPAWQSAAALYLLAGIATVNLAVARLEHFPAPPPARSRLWLTALWCVFAVALLGPLVGGTVRTITWRPDVAYLLGALLTAALCVTPFLTTGQAQPGAGGGRRYLAGLLPHRALRGDLPAGVPLLLAWVLFGLCLVPAGFLLAGRAALLGAPELAPGALLVLSVVAGAAAVGNLLSTLVSSRWTAAALTTLALVIAFFAPYVAASGWHQNPERWLPSFLLLYLAPFASLAELADPSGFNRFHPPLPLRPLWTVTVPLYIGIAAGAILLAAARLSRGGGRRAGPETEERPAGAEGGAGAVRR